MKTRKPSSASPSTNSFQTPSITNGVRVLHDNKIAVGKFNGNTFNVASGNTIKLGVLNSALSNNVLNSGADSFNTSKTVIKDSYNEVLSDGNKYTPKKHH
jgi:hypothetical protein